MQGVEEYIPPPIFINYKLYEFLNPSKKSYFSDVLISIALIITEMVY